MVCGSPGEVANNLHMNGEENRGAFVMETPQNFTGSIQASKQIIWTTIAFTAQDQLRQRMAWALSQIVVCILVLFCVFVCLFVPINIYICVCHVCAHVCVCVCPCVCLFWMMMMTRHRCRPLSRTRQRLARPERRSAANRLLGLTILVVPRSRTRIKKIREKMYVLWVLRQPSV